MSTWVYLQGVLQVGGAPAFRQWAKRFSASTDTRGPFLECGTAVSARIRPERKVPPGKKLLRRQPKLCYNMHVQPYEVEEAVINQPWIKRTRDGKYLAYGQTNAGRFLLVVLAPKAYNRMRPITARDMTVAEKHRFRQR